MNDTILDILEMEVLRGQVGQAYEVVLPSLKLAAGDVAAIVGPSGCGKSTLLEAIGLILEPQSVARFRMGQFDLTQDFTNTPNKREKRWASVRQHCLGFVPQSGGLLPFLNVRQNIELPRQLVGQVGPNSMLDQVIERLQLGSLMTRLPAQLSIGERQRVSFARAVSHQPSLLLADEPTAALDPILAKELFTLIIEIARDLNIAALIVTHEWALAQEVGIRRVVATVSAHRRTQFDAAV